jgi:RimJ/RimL family protein N-acetyltransferase
LRIGFDAEIYCSGNIGYRLDERYRGFGYAAKAANLVIPLAASHHMHYITITCNPDNIPSAKTAEKLGAKYLEFVKLPKESQQYKNGDRFKRRYVLTLER